MIASEPAAHDHVVIRCPVCGASESAEPDMLAGAPTIVCRECGETWPASPSLRRPAKAQSAAPTAAPPMKGMIDAQHKPLVTYSSGGEQAWAAKMAGDYWPEPPPQRRWPMTLGAAVAIAFLAAFIGGRDAAVTAVPDLGGLYAAIGLPVNLAGIAIEDVAANRPAGGNGELIVVQGIIRNTSRTPMAVPPLAAIVYGGKAQAKAESFDPPARTIGVGERTPFRLTLAAVPMQANKVAVRFSRPGEKLPRGLGLTQVIAQ